MRSNSRDFHQLDLFGPEAAPASPSPSLAEGEAQPTSGTSGPRCAGSSRSAALQSSLANKLRLALDVNGSPEYRLTWKHWALPSGLLICALRASGRHTSDSGFSGWPTPTKGNADGSQIGKDASATGKRPDGSKATVSLNQVSQLTGWGTPTSRDHKDGAATLDNTPTNGLLGRQVQSSSAPTEKRGALNPAFSRWLQGYPARWCEAAIRAHRLMPTRRRKRG